MVIAENTKDISVIQRTYAQEVEHVIRTATTNAYIAGVNYVGAQKQRMHSLFITHTDIDKIQALTQEFTHVFWRRMNVLLHQKDTFQSILNARFSPHSSLTLNSLVTSLAIRVVTKAMAIGTIQKANSLKRTKQSLIKSADAFVETMVWHTQEDEKVCPICEDLDGQSWSSDDPDMPVPPDDTHDNCRCTLDVESDTEEPTAAPEDTDNTSLLGVGAGIASTSLGLGLAQSEPDCPEGQIWAPKKKKCQDCEPDEHTDPKTGKCVKDNCPKDQHWDDDLQKCVDDE